MLKAQIGAGSHGKFKPTVRMALYTLELICHLLET